MANTMGIWAGIGFETGGEIILVLNSQAGAMISIDDLISGPSQVRWCSFVQESKTAGLGLGGSGGFNFVIGFNAAKASDFSSAESEVSFDF